MVLKKGGEEGPYREMINIYIYYYIILYYINLHYITYILCLSGASVGSCLGITGMIPTNPPNHDSEALLLPGLTSPSRLKDLAC